MRPSPGRQVTFVTDVNPNALTPGVAAHRAHISVDGPLASYVEFMGPIQPRAPTRFAGAFCRSILPPDHNVEAPPAASV